MPARTQPALGVGQGAAQHTGHRDGLERFQPEQVAAAEQRRVHVETGVVRRRADQPHRALLDVGQEQVLLRFVEAVQLVDEEHGRGLGPAARRRENFAELGDVGHAGVDAHEPAFRLAGDDLGEARLAAARRAVEEQAAEAVAGNQPGQQVTRLQDVLLPDDLAERPGPHPRRERLVRRGFARPVKPFGRSRVGQSGAGARSFLAKE